MNPLIKLFLFAVLIISPLSGFSGGGESVKSVIAGGSQYYFLEDSLKYYDKEKKQLLSGELSQEKVIPLLNQKLTFPKKTVLSFYPSGKIKYGYPFPFDYQSGRQTLRFTSKELGMRKNQVEFYESGGIKNATVETRTKIQSAGNAFFIQYYTEFYESGKIKLASLTEPFEATTGKNKLICRNMDNGKTDVQQMKYILFYESGAVKACNLENDAALNAGKTSMKVGKGTDVFFYPNGAVKKAFLKEDFVLSFKIESKNLECISGYQEDELSPTGKRTGDFVTFYENGNLEYCSQVNSDIPLSGKDVKKGSGVLLSEKGIPLNPKETLLKAVQKGYSFLLNFPLERSMLKDLKEKELIVLMNLIPARYEKAFKTKWILDYFSQFDWYSPEWDDVASYLTPLEKSNIDLIYKYFHEKFEKK